MKKVQSYVQSFLISYQEVYPGHNLPNEIVFQAFFFPFHLFLNLSFLSYITWFWPYSSLIFLSNANYIVLESRIIQINNIIKETQKSRK
jgi:hypothetical protein